MEIFDQLKATEADKRGFSKKIDLGWGRNGVFESTAVSQNCSPDIVCALPHMINKSKSEEFMNVTGLLDQMTEFMDKHFLDDRCKLFTIHFVMNNLHLNCGPFTAERNAELKHSKS